MSLNFQILKKRAQHMRATQQPLKRAVASLVSHLKSAKLEQWEDAIFVAGELQGLLEVWSRVQIVRGNSVFRDAICDWADDCIPTISTMRTLVRERIAFVCKTPSRQGWKGRFEDALAIQEI